MTKQEAWERTLNQVERDPVTQCWTTKAFRHRGYARILLSRHHSIGQHRLAYEIMRGTIPDKHEIHHLCNNKACCNPDHLQALDDLSHKRADSNWVGNRTHCKNGHPLEGDNLVANRKKVGLRLCRICNLARTKRQRHDRGDEFKLYNRESQKAWRLANPEHCAAYRKAYRAKAKEATRRYRERQKAKAFAAVPT
jgi:hypothetical protein